MSVRRLGLALCALLIGGCSAQHVGNRAPQSAASAPSRPDTNYHTTCAVTLSSATDTPVDGIGANRRDRDPFLPQPIFEVSSCRYRLINGSFRLTSPVYGQRIDLEPVRDLLNRSATAARATGCVSPTTVDVLWIDDTSGAVSEMRVWREPCQAVYPGHKPVVAASAELLAFLDRWIQE